MKRFLASAGILVAILATPMSVVHADTATSAPVAGATSTQTAQGTGEDAQSNEGHERGIRIDRDFGRSEPIQFIALGAALTAALVIAYGIGRRHRSTKSQTPQ